MTRQVTNHRKTNQQKMLYHQERLEYWQKIIDDAEDAALRLAKERIHELPRRKDGLLPDPHYVAKTILKDNYSYNRAIGNRNGHEKGVNVYGALYQAELAGK